MRGRILGAVVAVAVAAVATCAVRPASAAGPFDGVWAVTLVCATASDGARGYTFNFIAQVTNGTLHGEHGTAGTLSWLTLDGGIRPDGSSLLLANGLTGNPAFTVGRVQALTPYSYHVSAHFDATRGSGNRLELRPCTVAFVRS